MVQGRLWGFQVLSRSDEGSKPRSHGWTPFCTTLLLDLQVTQTLDRTWRTLCRPFIWRCPTTIVVDSDPIEMRGAPQMNNRQLLTIGMRSMQLSGDWHTKRSHKRSTIKLIVLYLKTIYIYNILKLHQHVCKDSTFNPTANETLQKWTQTARGLRRRTLRALRKTARRFLVPRVSPRNITKCFIGVPLKPAGRNSNRWSLFGVTFRLQTNKSC